MTPNRWKKEFNAIGIIPSSGKICIITIRIYEYLKKHVIDIAKKQKYNIEVYTLAVPNLESKKSAILREEDMDISDIKILIRKFLKTIYQ